MIPNYTRCLHKPRPQKFYPISHRGTLNYFKKVCIVYLWEQLPVKGIYTKKLNIIIIIVINKYNNNNNKSNNFIIIAIFAIIIVIIIFSFEHRLMQSLSQRL